MRYGVADRKAFLLRLAHGVRPGRDIDVEIDEKSAPLVAINLANNSL